MTERWGVRARDLVSTVFLGIFWNQKFFFFIRRRSPRKMPPNPAFIRHALAAACSTVIAAREALPYGEPLFWADVSLAGLDNAVIIILIFKELFCLG